jgi:hypothetical protein
MTDSTDFYEDDEPVEDVIDAWNSGEAGRTAPPMPFGAVVLFQGAYQSPLLAPSVVGHLVTEGPVNRGSSLVAS